MSFVSNLKAAARWIVCVDADECPLYVELRRPTTGDAVLCSATALIVPEAPGEADLAAARERLRSPEAKRELALASLDTQARIVATCLLAVGPSPDELEPVTLCVNEGNPVRPGTEALPLYALPPGAVRAIAQLIWNDGEWRKRTASFRPKPAGGAGGDGEGVGGAAVHAA